MDGLRHRRTRRTPHRLRSIAPGVGQGQDFVVPGCQDGGGEPQGSDRGPVVLDPGAPRRGRSICRTSEAWIIAGMARSTARRRDDLSQSLATSQPLVRMVRVYRIRRCRCGRGRRTPTPTFPRSTRGLQYRRRGRPPMFRSVARAGPGQGSPAGQCRRLGRQRSVRSDRWHIAYAPTGHYGRVGVRRSWETHPRRCRGKRHQ